MRKLVVFLSLTLGTLGCFGRAKEVLVSREPSPDRRYEAIITVALGKGLLGEDSYSVYVVYAGDTIPDPDLSIFSATEVDSLAVHWRHPRMVEIAFPHASISRFWNKWPDLRESNAAQASRYIELRLSPLDSATSIKEDALWRRP